MAEGADILLLAREHFASRSAVASLINEVKKNGLPQSCSRATQYRKRKRFFIDTQTPYGSLASPYHVAGQEISVQSPAAMLHYCAEHCEPFGHLLQRARSIHGDSEWSLVLYIDGVSPEDALSKNDKRKFTAAYWTILEYGMEALATEEVWFVLLVARNTVLADIPGGISRVCSEVFDSFFFNPGAGVDFEQGVMLPLNGSAFSLRCALNICIADEVALKELFAAKGHAGIRCCYLCWNIVQARYWNEARDAASGVRSTCRRFEAFNKHSDDSIRAVLQALEDAAEAGHDVSQMQTMLGWNHVYKSFAHHAKVRVASITMFDWMHVYLVGGLMGQELGWTLLKLHVIGVRVATVGAFVRKWCWPKVHKARYEVLFQKSRESYASGFPCTASELLSLVPVLGIFFASLAPGTTKPFVDSLLACIDAVELLQVDEVLFRFSNIAERGRGRGEPGTFATVPAEEQGPGSSKG